MSIVRLWNCEASKPRTFRVGNGSFDDVDLDSRGEACIECGVVGPSEELADDSDDAGLIGASSGSV
jgi:hypothetical protein